MNIWLTVGLVALAVYMMGMYLFVHHHRVLRSHADFLVSLAPKGCVWEPPMSARGVPDQAAPSESTVILDSNNFDEDFGIVTGIEAVDEAYNPLMSEPAL